MGSRLIVKNLPKNITESKLRQLFEEKGTITDIQLKYTKDGIFRQFAFIGYQNEDDANVALKYFNNSFLQTARIKVEHCEALGSEQKPKSWSRHATDSEAYRKLHGIDEKERLEKEKKKLEEKKLKKKNKIEEIIGEHKDDPEFQEFMKVHDKNRTLWANDEFINEEKGGGPELESVKTSKKVQKDEEKIESEGDASESEGEKSEEDSDSDSRDEESKNVEEQVEEKLALKNEISDLEYMKSLMKNKTSEIPKSKVIEKKTKTKPESIDLLTIKIRNIPFKTKKQDIIQFFKPLKPYSIRVPRGKTGFCYVGFKQEKDFKKAMLKDKSFIKGKQVFLSNFTEQNKRTKLQKEEEAELEKNGKWTKQQEGLQNEEEISESGKIFFRNLAYTVVDDDIQKLFENFGPIAEISLPIDPVTRKIKGFGTVTFVMPEHAVLAFNELDGSTFHGRLLHLIPGKSKDHEEQDENTDGLSFKAKKAIKLKKSAGQSHNWNMLFMGSNAVADILAKQFNASKETILDSNAGGSSAAVRLALGETQIIMEMKKFLEDNDVQLNVFESEPKKRSKTVILAKNLPAETTVEELTPLFAKFGLLGRLVLPPSGVTAIIEFLDPSEAKKAFYKLAYSKFKHLPLYLEWAPENTFKGTFDGDSKTTIVKKTEEEENSSDEKVDETNNTENDNKKDENHKEQNNENDDDDDEPPETGTTLFLHNLNFSTREEAVRNHFKHLGKIHIVQVAMRKDPQNPSVRTSLGYGFIQFKKNATLERALKEMQMTTIEGNTVTLKRSDRTLKTDIRTTRKKTQQTAQTGSKLLIRNIPFQAKPKEIYEIFKAFGELRSVRLPKKLTPGEQSLRGFGFVDYISKSDAKKAFDNCSGSTHLYGRRLVLEWAKNDEEDISELRKRTAEGFKDTGIKKVKYSNKAVFDDSEINDTSNKNDDDEDEMDN